MYRMTYAAYPKNVILHKIYYWEAVNSTIRLSKQMHNSGTLIVDEINWLKS